MSVQLHNLYKAIPSRVVGMIVGMMERIVAFLTAKESAGKPLYVSKNNVQCLYKRHTVGRSDVYHTFFNKHPILGSGNLVLTEFN